MVRIDDLRSGDRRTLARSITLLESTRQDHQTESEKLIQTVIPYSGNSLRIGLTGVPGVGKSTLIETLGNHVIELGHKIAVLAVDPSSTLSGGSILGDKTRMPSLSVNKNAFIRPTPAGETQGGVARRTRESIILCEAAGFDVIVVETVGVGQSETLVSEMTDIFLLMLLPGGGDELQGIKRGIMELADMVVVNKADGDQLSKAKLSAADIQQALRLIKPRHQGWRVPVITSSATERINIVEIWDEVKKLKTTLDAQDSFYLNRQMQSRNWLWTETKELLLSQLKNDSKIKSLFPDLQEDVVKNEISPTKAARVLVDQFLKTVGNSKSK